MLSSGIFKHLRPFISIREKASHLTDPSNLHRSEFYPGKSVANFERGNVDSRRSSNAYDSLVKFQSDQYNHFLGQYGYLAHVLPILLSVKICLHPTGQLCKEILFLTPVVLQLCKGLLKRNEGKIPPPGGINIHSLKIKRHVLYHCASVTS